jgi:Acyltransferase family
MKAASAEPTAGAEGAAGGSTRDEFIDLCRAFSLLVVVLWHWVFTIVVWRASGPSADSPLGFTRNLWILTWVLQVMPVFFFVGGYAHMQLWLKLRGSAAGFVLGRMRRLLVPSLALLGVWAAIAAVAEGVFHVYWFGRAALLIVSPLWFIAVYLALVLLTPLAIRLHQRFGPLVVVVMVGVAALVDVLRFGQHLAWAALINLLVVWALCHQLGFFYRRLVDGDRIVVWCFVWGGLFGLVGLVLTTIYPPSMVGMPGDRISNMGTADAVHRGAVLLPDRPGAAGAAVGRRAAALPGLVAGQRGRQPPRAAAVPVPHHRLRDRLQAAVADRLPAAEPPDPRLVGAAADLAGRPAAVHRPGDHGVRPAARRPPPPGPRARSPASRHGREPLVTAGSLH